MEIEIKVSNFIMLFLVLFLISSLIWGENIPIKTKLAFTLSIVIPVVLAIVVIILVENLTKNTIIAYLGGFFVFLVGHVISEYLTLREINVSSFVVGVLIGIFVIVLQLVARDT